MPDRAYVAHLISQMDEPFDLTKDVRAVFVRAANGYMLNVTYGDTILRYALTERESLDQDVLAEKMQDAHDRFDLIAQAKLLEG